MEHQMQLEEQMRWVLRLRADDDDDDEGKRISARTVLAIL